MTFTVVDYILKRLAEQPMAAPAGATPAVPGPAAGPLTYKQVFERVAVARLVIPDTFLGIYSAANAPVKERNAFLCSGVSASIGHSVAAAVGASFGSARRPLVICGDGGFHMTAQALSTMVQYGSKPVVVILANGIYGCEQFLVDESYFQNPAKQPRPYTVLNQWDFEKFAGALGVRFARTVNTAAAFDAALAATKGFDGPAVIVAQIDPHGLPTELP